MTGKPGRSIYAISIWLSMISDQTWSTATCSNLFIDWCQILGFRRTVAMAVLRWFWKGCKLSQFIVLNGPGRIPCVAYDLKREETWWTSGICQIFRSDLNGYQPTISFEDPWRSAHLAIFRKVWSNTGTGDNCIDMIAWQERQESPNPLWNTMNINSGSKNRNI